MSAEIADFDPADVPPGAIRRALVPFATRADGSPATFPLIVIAGTKEGPLAVLFAGINGDEYEGPAALWQLANTTDPASLAGRPLIVPCANLAAFAAGMRTSPIDLQNLARIFPGDADGTLSHRLAHALFTRVVQKADFLIDCHSGGVRLAFLDVAGFYGEGDGISAELSAQSLALAKDLGLAHLWRLPDRIGVLSFEAMRHGIPATGAEIGGRSGLLAADAQSYVDGILRVLARRGMISPASTRPDKTYTTCLVGDWALAPVGGFIENRVAIGDRVKRGASLATIVSPLGDTLAELRAATDGIVTGVRHLRSIQAGEWATCVVEEQPL
jgi:hypothetical protein